MGVKRCNKDNPSSLLVTKNIDLRYINFQPENFIANEKYAWVSLLKNTKEFIK